jgi:hypothetical protein
VDCWADRFRESGWSRFSEGATSHQSSFADEDTSTDVAGKRLPWEQDAPVHGTLRCGSDGVASRGEAGKMLNNSRLEIRRCVDRFVADVTL